MFIKHHIYSETELESRYEIRIENYTKTIHIEALTLTDMVQKQFAPALMDYIDDLTASVMSKKELGIEKAVASQKELIEKLAGLYEEVIKATEKLAADTDKAEAMESDINQAKFYHDVIVEDMNKIREFADEAEPLIPEGYLPYPTYEQILFYV
jgi:glutamine synthetase